MFHWKPAPPPGVCFSLWPGGLPSPGTPRELRGFPGGWYFSGRMIVFTHSMKSGNSVSFDAGVRLLLFEVVSSLGLTDILLYRLVGPSAPGLRFVLALLYPEVTFPAAPFLMRLEAFLL